MTSYPKPTKILINRASTNIDDFLIACIVKFFYPKFDEVDIDKCIIQLESDVPDKRGRDDIMIVRGITNSNPLENQFSKGEIREMRFSGLFNNLLENYSLKQETLVQLFNKITPEISLVIHGEKHQNLVQDFGNCRHPEGRLAIASHIVNTIIEENS